MEAIVIGLGSMGRRRVRLLHDLDPSVQIIGIDMLKERRKQAADELGIMTEETVDAACRGYRPEMAFVSTSPLSHCGIIKECLEKNLHVFTELNLVDLGYDDNMELAKKNDRVLFLSSTFLYRKEIQYIKRTIEESKSTISYMYHAGQYLPDWHPWESYKNFFVGDKRTNGCREFMAIEFPWIVEVFGKIKYVHSKCSKDSSLDIAYPDTYQIMFEHESGHRGLITIDIVSRKAVRKLEISGESLYLTWGGTPDSLFQYNYIEKTEKNILLYESVENREGYSDFIIEDAYRSEIENFIRVIRDEEEARYSFRKDKEILELIDKIEKSEDYIQ